MGAICDSPATDAEQEEIFSMSLLQVTLSRAFNITEEQAKVFLKGFSAGLLAGASMIKIYQDCLNLIPEVDLTEDDFPVRLRSILMENRDKHYCGLEQPITEETINAIVGLLFMKNGTKFLNNIIL